MKIFNLLFLLVLICFSKSSSAWPSPSRESCKFYQQLESEINCKSESTYLLSYGFPYCSKFQNKKSQWRGKLLDWIPVTTECLQSELVRDPKLLKPCKLMEDTAFGGHPTCYMKGGFCGFTYPERQAVMDVVAMSDVAGALTNSLIQMIRVKMTCDIGLADSFIHLYDFIFGFTRSQDDETRTKASEILVSKPENVDEVQYTKFVKLYLMSGELELSSGTAKAYAQVSASNQDASYEDIVKACARISRNQFCNSLKATVADINRKTIFKKRIHLLHQMLAEKKTLKTKGK